MTESEPKSNRDRRVDSVGRLVRLLESICADGGAAESIPDAVRASLPSQVQLAALVVPELGLVGMSLNTQKSIADEHFGGYSRLNNLRSAARQAVERQNARRRAPRRETKESLRLQIRELEAQVGRLHGDLSVLTDGFGKLAAFARAQAVELGAPLALARFQKELRALESGLSLLTKPVSTNVTRGDFGGR